MWSLVIAPLALALSAPLLHAEFAYVANYGSNNVSAFTIDAITGALTPVPGSPFAAGEGPRSVTVDPTGRFVYVANGYGSNVSAYTISAATGALTPIPGSPFAAGAQPLSVVVDPTGKFAYVVNNGNNNISAYTINAATGALTPVPGSPFAAGSFVWVITVDPTGKFVFVGNTAGNVLAYTINAATGALTPVPGSPFATGGGATSIAVNPTGKFAYITASSSVYAYTINAATGALTPVPGSPFAADSSPTAVTVDLTGKFVYVPNFLGGISGYTINAATGALTPIASSPFLTPRPLADSVTVNLTGKFVYVAHQINNISASPYNSYNVSAYMIDPATGALTLLAGSPLVAAGSVPLSITTTAGPLQATLPTADSVTPNSSTSSTQIFTFKYSSALGFAYLNAVYAVINDSLSVPNGCVAVYVQSTNSIYLANDTGSGVTGPLTPGSANTLSTNQCTINGIGSSAGGVGRTLSLALSITSKTAFKGLKAIYGYAADNGGMASGWQTLGTYLPNPVSILPPTTDSVTPNNGGSLAQTFVYKYSSPGGFAYINYTYSLINSSLIVQNGCLTLYVQNANALYLFNDGGTAIIGPITPGLPGSLSNSQCTISGPGSSASGSGNTLEVVWRPASKTRFWEAR